MKVVKYFEDSGSLYSMKKEIEKNFLKDKYFIQNYKFNFDPIDNQLQVNLSCPKPFFKVVLMDEEAQGETESILVDGGDLFDPTYETLLSGEKKIKYTLPVLAIKKKNLSKENRIIVSNLVSDLGISRLPLISELILDDQGRITMILSLNRRPVSVFYGSDDISNKTNKLSRLLDYVEKNKKHPSVINLINPKKVVVKFADKK